MLYVLVALYIAGFLISTLEVLTIAGHRAANFRISFALSAGISLLWAVASGWCLIKLKRKQSVGFLWLPLLLIGFVLLAINFA